MNAERNNKPPVIPDSHKPSAKRPVVVPGAPAASAPKTVVEKPAAANPPKP